MKKTAQAPANIAFIKYWGLKNNELRIPTNGSISMNLSGLLTTVTVEIDDALSKDDILINGKADTDRSERVRKHLDLIRNKVGLKTKARVATHNNFPMATGLASSASAFSALTFAAVSAYETSLSEREISILARQGSGSSCRSIPSGFVEWIGGDSSESSYAQSIFPPDFWDIVDIVAVVSTDEKKVSSTQGHLCVLTSPFFSARLSHIDVKLKSVKDALGKRDFDRFGSLIEQEALELQAIGMTSKPPILYMSPETIEVLQFVQKLRENGLPLYFTLDAGPNVHIFVEAKNKEKVLKELQRISSIKELISNVPAAGAKIVERHLF